MAHLLGAKNCVDSLCKDVANMEESIQIITSKIGRLDFASWKFPGKKACEIDIEELLEDYAYCNDDDSNKLSHIVLFELVIDRFCILLQSVVHWLDSTITSNPANNERPMSRTVTTTMSVGLITKMFWNKMLQFQFAYQKLDKEVDKLNTILMEQETSHMELKLENDALKNKKNAKQQKATENSEQKTEPKLLTDKKNLAVDSMTVSTQTYETAFLPCEACARMQENLMSVGCEVIRICESQRLPSSLSKQKKLMNDMEMTASDVSRWTTEQNKDLQKINKHLDSLYKEINPLKKQVEELQIACKRKEDELDSLSLENDKYRLDTDTFQQKFNEAEKLHLIYKEKSCEYEKKISELNAEVDKMGTEKDGFSKAVQEKNNQIGSHENTIENLKQNVQSLTSQLEEQLKNTEKLKDYDNVQQEMKVQYEALKKCEEELTKVKNENKVLLKHDQSLQTKQATLLTRLEALDETCEELRNENDTMEKAKEKLMEENAKLIDREEKQTDEYKALKNEIEQLKNSNQDTVSDEQLIKMKEQLQLIVSYPVIGANYRQAEQEYQNIVNESDYMLRNNGDVVNDMERQIVANSTRITILEEQNRSLEKSLSKLEQASTNTEQSSAHELHDNRKDRNNSAPQRLQSNSSVTPKPPDEPRSTNALRRPRSANKSKKTEAFDISSRLANLDRQKNTNTNAPSFEWDLEPKKAWDEKSKETETKQNGTAAAINCPDCDKAYISQRDLDIHKNFCYGKL